MLRNAVNQPWGQHLAEREPLQKGIKGLQAHRSRLKIFHLADLVGFAAELWQEESPVARTTPA